MRRLVCASLTLLTSCAGLPSLSQRVDSHVLEDTHDTRLGRGIAPLAAAHPERSGIYALSEALDAFAARGVLAEAADRSIDAQYYIWRDDQSGGLLFDALLRAAERGVRVRLLLDDINTGGLDDALATLDAHANVEVRLFNPFVHRGARWLDFTFDFSRVNRRMHNKSFTVDNQATIVGGRNVGDEYFGSDEHIGFADLDVIAVGPVVGAVSREFDAYWNSASAYPAADLLGERSSERMAAVREQWTARRGDERAQRYLAALRTTELAGHLIDGELPLEWAPARVLSDDAAKVLHASDRKDLQLLPRLAEALGEPQRELDLVSPYFVPTKEGVDAFVKLEQRGVHVRVLTNSLSATDVGMVHAGYATRRRALLEGGVELFELKKRSDAKSKDKKGVGSSDVSLHAKTFGVDRERIFVGSFNFDPRSAHLNTEMGLLIESPALATRLAETLDRGLANSAYSVRLDADGDLEWTEQSGDGERTWDHEPETGWWRRAGVKILSWLPIEWLL